METITLRAFEFGHLDAASHGIAGEFYGLACTLMALIQNKERQAVALKALLDARNAAMEPMATG